MRRAGPVLIGYGLVCAGLYYGLGVHEEPHAVKQVVRCALGLPVLLIAAWSLGALTRALLACASIGLCLVVAELCLPLVHAGSAHQQGIQHVMRFDPRLGWAFAPGKTAVVEDADYTTLVRTNAAGFRDREYTPGDGRPVLLVLGDSFTSNIGVDLEASFTSVLDAALPGRSVRNRGVNGYGQVQEWLLLQDLLERERPADVLVVLYVRNDLDAPAPPRPLERLEELVTGSAVCSLVRGGLRRLARGRRELRLDEQPPEWRYCRSVLAARERDAVDVTLLLLGRMADACAAAGASFGVVVAPTVWQVYPERWNALIESAGSAPEAFDVGRPQAEVGAWCEAADVPCLDLLPALREHGARGEDLYYPREHHWNALGNRRVAEALRAWIGESAD